MNYTEFIKERDRIKDKIYNKEKITADERYWLRTTPVFNNKYDYPVYMSDIIKLLPNCLYEISIKVKLLNCNYSIYPQIGVAGLKGKIITRGKLKNIDDEIVDYNETKLLVLLLDENNVDSKIDFIAKDGLLSVEYFCSFYDDKMKIVKKMSSTSNYSFGMQKRVVSDNCVEYSCKSVFAESFDALVFSLEWTKKE